MTVANSVSTGTAEALEDLRSHRGSWRRALELSLAMAAPAGVDHDDASYWRHELTAFDRTFDALCSGIAQGQPGCGEPPDAGDFAALREIEIAWLSDRLSESIAGLGYPVGMGIAPHPESIKKAATILFERYAKMIEMARRTDVGTPT